MLKSLKLLKKYREILLDVTMEEPEDFDEIGISFINQFDEAIVELEALQTRSCDGCKFHDDVGWDDWCCDCIRKWTIDRYEAKETRV